MSEPPPPYPSRPSESPSTPYSDAKPLRILLVEDSQDNVLVLQLYLKEMPFEVETAPNGRAALDRFQSEDFDLVIMDIQMPVMDGYEATLGMRRLEEDSGRERTPIVALTAHASEENRQRVLEVGCDDYLTKPIPKARLLEAIGQATGCFS